MNAAERKAYRSLRDVPHGKFEEAGREALRRAVEAHFKRQADARAERKSRLDPAFEAMRAAALKSPETKLLRGPISKATKLPKRYKHPHLPASSLKSPLVRLGSIHVVDVPPFQTVTGFNQNGEVSMIGLNANSNGSMNFYLMAGTSAAGEWGAGTADCWAAVGQAYAFPSPEGPLVDASHLKGILTFSVNPSVNWMAQWVSTFWRQAAGNIWIGQVVNQFEMDGTFVGTPVSTQQSLESFDDYNLCDTGSQMGASSGVQLTCSLPVEDGMFYECWATIAGSATGDFSDEQSWAVVSIQATANPLIIDFQYG